MTLSELQQILATSKPSDWNLVADAGPETGERRDYAYEGGGHATRLHLHRSDVHSHVASYRADVSYTIAWGRLPAWASDERPEKADGWATFTDTDVSPLELDLFWNGAIVDRHLLASVDGASCTLPRPTQQTHRQKTEKDPLGEVKTLGWTTTKWHVDVARLINGLTRAHLNVREDEFESYMETSGIIVDPGE